MEEQNEKNHPNLPSNYVTLLQLQERWIKEQKRKQEEIEKQKEEKNDVVFDESEKSKSGGEKQKKKKYGKKKKTMKEKSEKGGQKEENENADVEAEVKEPRRRSERVKVVWKKVGDDLAEGSDRTVEIAEKLESIKVAEENDVSRGEKSGYVGKNYASEGKSGGYNGRYGRGNRELRGYSRDFGRNGRINRYRGDDGNQMVWVKKEVFVGVKDEKSS